MRCFQDFPHSFVFGKYVVKNYWIKLKIDKGHNPKVNSISISKASRSLTLHAQPQPSSSCSSLKRFFQFRSFFCVKLVKYQTDWGAIRNINGMADLTLFKSTLSLVYMFLKYPSVISLAFNKLICFKHKTRIHFILEHKINSEVRREIHFIPFAKEIEFWTGDFYVAFFIFIDVFDGISP